jgi:hypothetical protein
LKTTLSIRLAIDCLETDLLFHTALACARTEGQTVGAYNEARRRSSHEMVHDVETVLRAALTDAGCRLAALDSPEERGRKAGSV